MLVFPSHIKYKAETPKFPTGFVNRNLLETKRDDTHQYNPQNKVGSFFFYLINSPAKTEVPNHIMLVSCLTSQKQQSRKTRLTPSAVNSPSAKRTEPTPTAQKGRAGGAATDGSHS